MPALYVMIPIAIVIVALAIWLFFWAVGRAVHVVVLAAVHSILFDDEDPQHQAGVDEAAGKHHDQDAPRG